MLCGRTWLGMRSRLGLSVWPWKEMLCMPSRPRSLRLVYSAVPLATGMAVLPATCHDKAKQRSTQSGRVITLCAYLCS